MRKGAPQKKPLKFEKQQRKRSDALKPVAPPGWLPDPDAGFVSWAAAVVQAQRELHEVCRQHQKYRDEKEWAREVESVREVFYDAVMRAYPPRFWEDMVDLYEGKPVDLEKYIAFLEADLFFYRSGYAKVDVIRGLKRVPLSPEQQTRLQKVVLQVIDKGFRREFRHYCRLARRIQSPDWLHEVEERLASPDRLRAIRARWVLDSCTRP